MFKFLVCLFLNLIVGNPCVVMVSLYFMSMMALYTCGLSQFLFYLSGMTKSFVFLSFLVGGLSVSWSKVCGSVFKPSVLLPINILLVLLLVMSFTANSLLGLYFFLESSMIPVMCMIFLFGNQPERMQAGVYLMVYMMFGMLPLILFIGKVWDSSSLYVFYLKQSCSDSIFFIFSVMGFMVKVPAFPFHVWLPKAHVESPLGGSIFLAGAMLKMGVLGVSIVMALLNPSPLVFSAMMSTFMFGGVYSCFCCIRESDVKGMIAYSSVAHMSVVICSMLSGCEMGFEGSLYMSIAHGVLSPLMLSVAGMSYECVFSRSVFLSKGVFSSLPHFFITFFSICAFSMSAPPSLGFLGEVYMVASLLAISFYLIFFYLLMFVLTGVYIIGWYSLFCHGGSMSMVSSTKSITVMNYFMSIMPLSAVLFFSVKTSVFF